MTYGCYVHIPCCIKKCRYCDFVSFPVNRVLLPEYVDAILTEARDRSSEIDDRFRTVYIGGGTPSLLPAELTERLFGGLSSILDLSGVSEWTVEANPGSASVEWLKTAVGNGCNRLSLGAQAFQPGLLKMLGRPHNAEDIARAVRDARKAGFSDINLDLMFGLPGQSARDWEDTLDSALALEPQHISAYGLIPEQGTPLKADIDSGRLSLPDPDAEREMYDTAIRVLASHGFEQYEISNFAKNGFRCEHNIGYWKQRPYIGLGTAAVSMLFPKTTEKGFVYERRTNPFCIGKYARGVYAKTNSSDISAENIGNDESRFETLMLGLRLTEGVSESEFFALHGISLSEWRGKKLSRLAAEGLLLHADGNWRLTRRGMDIQNSVLVELMES